MKIFISQARSVLKILLLILASTLPVKVWAFLDPIDFCEEIPYYDPLLIDLGQNGVHLGQAGITIMFDLAANGNPVKMQWTAPGGDEAFLILDKNNNGLADNGGEMFTNYNTLQLENRIAPNGFVDLAQYDLPELGGNDDGKITIQDTVWEQLWLWLDKNADGIATADEMLKPLDLGITEFNTLAKINNRRDSAGNRLPFWAWANSDANQGNSRYKMVDVYFKTMY